MPLPLHRQICFTLYATSLEVGRTYKPMLDELGITYPQYLVLCALGEEDDMSIGAIATYLGLVPSTITPLVKRMETGGLVTRTRGRADERQVSTALTDRGRSVLKECDCLGDALIKRSKLTLDGLEELNRQIQMLRAALIASEA